MPATTGTRKPDYTVSVMNKDTQKKLPNAGGAWKNQDGSIFISFNPCVMLSGNDNIAIALFPANNNYQPEQSSPKRSQRQSPTLDPMFDEDAPY